MRIKLPMVAVWNGPALIRITPMRIQCGRMQHALLRNAHCWTSVDRPLVTDRQETDCNMRAEGQQRKQNKTKPYKKTDVA